MIAITVDDERPMLNALTDIVKSSPDIKEVHDFSVCSAALCSGCSLPRPPNLFAETAMIVYPFFQDLSFALNMILAINPAIMAAVIPPAVAFNPPVKMPMKPEESTASFTPFDKVYPNPVKGTVAPAPAKSAIGL